MAPRQKITLDDWARIFPGASMQGLDLLHRMLRFDQNKRITVEVGFACWGEIVSGVVVPLSIVHVFFSSPVLWVAPPCALGTSVHASSSSLPFPPFIQEALNHPYLAELHAKAREPVCSSVFDYSFEKDYPEEMPQKLLQEYMYADMVALQAEQARKGASSVGGAGIGGGISITGGDASKK
jgi:hypothetical protein